MQGRGLFITVSALTLCLLSGCDTSKPADPPVTSAKKAIDPRFSRIETLAQQSCLCELAGRDHTQIDLALKAATQGLQVEGFVETSAPLAGLGNCYPELGENACTTVYYPTSAPDSLRVCNLDQVEELEKIWRTADSARGGSAEAADGALLKRAAAMRQELAKSIPLSTCN